MLWAVGRQRQLVGSVEPDTAIVAVAEKPDGTGRGLVAGPVLAVVSLSEGTVNKGKRADDRVDFWWLMAYNLNKAGRSGKS